MVAAVGVTGCGAITILGLLEKAAATVPDAADARTTVAVIEAQRAALLDARDERRFGGGALSAALVVLAAEQISIELKGRVGNDVMARG